jgi:hypothetical protein
MELPARIAATTLDGSVTQRGSFSASLSKLLSARRLIVFVLLASIFTMTAGAITDPDFWWHLRTGQLIFETRAVPHADPFSFTAHGARWVAHEWLTEVLIFAVFKFAGWGRLVMLFSLVMTAALGLAYLSAARRGAHPFVACAATLTGALATAPIWGVRPQMISFFFTSLFVLVLDDYARDGHDYARNDHSREDQCRVARRRRTLWLLVPVTLVWANMHGGFALGLALVALTGAGVALDELLRRDATRPDEVGATRAHRIRCAWARVRPLCFVFAACAAVVPLNPNGVRLFAYPFETINSRAMQRYIIEWFSPDFHQPYAHALAALLFATFAALALSPKRARAGEVLLVCVAAYASLRAWRNIPLFALVAIPPLAEHAWAVINDRLRTRRDDATANERDANASERDATASAHDEDRQTIGAKMTVRLALNAALLICVPLGLCALRVSRVAHDQSSVEAEKFPAAAVEFLRVHGEADRVFNAYGWGGYMIWKLYPPRRVFIDGRADVYGDALVEQYLSAEGGEHGWRATLDEYSVNAAMLPPDAPLASLLATDAGWRKVYEDKQAVIFFRQDKQ